jgi:hypothetical protein
MTAGRSCASRWLGSFWRHRRRKVSCAASWQSSARANGTIRGAGGNEEAEPIAKITALLRADPKLTKKNARLIEDIVINTYNQLRGASR